MCFFIDDVLSRMESLLDLSILTYFFFDLYPNDRLGIDQSQHYLFILSQYDAHHMYTFVSLVLIKEMISV